MFTLLTFIVWFATFVAVNRPDNDRFYEELGIRVKKSRLRLAGFSQGKLAKMLDLSRTSVVNIEKGRQRIQVHILQGIALALNVNPAELIPSGVAHTDDVPADVKTRLTTQELPSVARILSIIQNKEANEDAEPRNGSKRAIAKSKGEQSASAVRKNRKAAKSSG